MQVIAFYSVCMIRIKKGLRSGDEYPPNETAYHDWSNTIFRPHISAGISFARLIFSAG